ncbi:MAG: hypothetical protein EOP04_16630 [Proteobacteria bacterium]|nr:MAG: hypothetical protein EOP04_16630 [Pseudomonadota bacterium]
MKKTTLCLLLFLATHISALGQDLTVYYDPNAAFYRDKRLLGTWFDYSWTRPVMRGYMLSRRRTDSSGYSFSFLPNGQAIIQSLHATTITSSFGDWQIIESRLYVRPVSDTLYIGGRLFFDGDSVVNFQPRPPSPKFKLKALSNN